MPHETSLLYKDPRDKTQVYQAPALQVRFRGRSGYVLPALGIDKKRVRLRDEAVETSVVQRNRGRSQGGFEAEGAEGEDAMSQSEGFDEGEPSDTSLVGARATGLGEQGGLLFQTSYYDDFLCIDAFGSSTLKEHLGRACIALFEQSTRENNVAELRSSSGETVGLFYYSLEFLADDERLLKDDWKVALEPMQNPHALCERMPARAADDHPDDAEQAAVAAADERDCIRRFARSEFNDLCPSGHLELAVEEVLNFTQVREAFQAKLADFPENFAFQEAEGLSSYQKKLDEEFEYLLKVRLHSDVCVLNLSYPTELGVLPGEEEFEQAQQVFSVALRTISLGDSVRLELYAARRKGQDEEIHDERGTATIESAPGRIRPVSSSRYFQSRPELPLEERLRDPLVETHLLGKHCLRVGELALGADGLAEFYLFMECDHSLVPVLMRARYSTKVPP